MLDQHCIKVKIWQKLRNAFGLVFIQFFFSLGITIFKEFLKNNDGNIVPFESVALTLSSTLEPRESVPNCKPVAGKRVLSSIYAASVHLAVARAECLINHLSSFGEKPLENPYRIPEFHIQFCSYYAHICRCHCHNMHTVPKGKVCYLSPLTEQQNVIFPQVLTFPEGSLCFKHFKCK